MIGANETIDVPSVGGRKPRTLMRKTLVDIIEPRVEEIASLIYEEIRKSGSEKTPCFRGGPYRGMRESRRPSGVRGGHFQPSRETGISHRSGRSGRRGE